jgi:uncharacterized membrane protein YphA (DoxX/SURF4 family)
MKNFLSNKIFLFVIRLIIGGVFIYAAYDKIIHPDEFAKAINNYKILPLFLVNIMAIVLPVLELVTGLLLILGIFTKANTAIIATLLIVFIIALTSAWIRGLDINCGCFSLETTSTKSDIGLRIVEDLLMLAGCLLIYKFTNGKINNNPEGIKNE